MLAEIAPPVAFSQAMVEQRRSVYIGGGAGSGKSYLLQKIRQRLPSATVLATTGAAACLVGGSTLHSWAGAHDRLLTSALTGPRSHTNRCVVRARAG